MSQQAEFLNTTITAANIVELTKKTLSKVGLVYVQPLPESVQEEKISKAIIKNAVKGASQ